ncbi:MAG: biopolymer transporter ExbD [Planctomycetes bacterium]|jgi:biopolymer transport protein ExbD|nr:biopolymer transporter ExbD [Planctomycetota bacterium]MCL4731450.1 biopolymer transporter ExbD [Planctomycetota bacterium]
MARKRSRQQDAAEVDLTPMIDVVFQLIIFFMVVTQITTQDNVNLRLPDALAANEEDPQAKKIFTVHIAPANQSRADDALPDQFGWFCFGEPRPKSIEEMRAILARQATLVDPGKEYTGLNANGISENMVYVRVDARAPSGEFAKLIEMMVEAKMYRIKVGIMKDIEIN